jgi:hypothetical protein
MRLGVGCHSGRRQASLHLQCQRRPLEAVHAFIGAQQQPVVAHTARTS